MVGYQQFDGQWGERARLAQDTLALKPTRGIGSWMSHVMDIAFQEQYLGRAAGDFSRDPEGVYLAFQQAAGACFVDQWIPRNPLTMGQHGYGAGTQRTATTGAERIIRDGMAIDTPEAVVEHLERFVWPRIRHEIDTFEQQATALRERLIAQEVAVQRFLGTNLLKGPYSEGFQDFPRLRYGQYGYTDYFMAYALYPEVIERDFGLQADLAVLKNATAAEAIIEGALPRMVRLDHDMADSRGTLVDIRSLDRVWFPHFARSIQPFLDAGIRLIWHCDGNLMQMVPRLIECGLGGFQGFQYEDGMDYEGICRMTDRDGRPLLIEAGVSVTRTMPFGTPEDVRKEMRWLVEAGPNVGLLLGFSSSLAPGVPHENIRAYIEGLAYYRERGRG
jgi:hypothetical protein